MKSLNEWLVCLLNGIFGFKSIHYHPSTWMQIINAYVDNEIYEIVHLLNIIGFKTIFSCQDFYDNRNSFQIVIHNSRSLLFECFLIRHSIPYYGKVAVVQGVSFLLTKNNSDKLLEIILKFIN